MSNLTRAQRAQVLRLLLKGSSIRAVGRSTGLSYNSVSRLFADAAAAFVELQDEAFRDLKCKRLHLDYVSSSAGLKAKNVRSAKASPFGDIWTWVSIDADTKLVPSWQIGDCSSKTAIAFVDDLTSRLVKPVQITTDGRKAHLDAIKRSCKGDLDYEILTRVYGLGRKRRGLAAQRIGTRAARSARGPRADDRSAGRRALSKKIDEHARALALRYMHYNFCCIQKALCATPAMAAGVTGRLWKIDDLVQVLENWEAAKLLSSV